MIKPKKNKICKACKKEFVPQRSFQSVCSNFECAISYAKAKTKTNQSKDKRKAIKTLKMADRSYLTKIAQQVFNKYIRKRDENLPCYTCGHTGGRQRHASHFRPSGRNSKHRFNEMNVKSACSICNNHLSGNLVPYREALVRDYGLEAVEALENDNEPKKWSIEELKEIIEKYKEMYKKLDI